MRATGDHQPDNADASRESRRLAALEGYRILDTPAERAFDELAALAAHICGTPISLVSLVDEQRQWFKAAVGLDVRETPRSLSFCHYAIQRPEEVMVVENATQDARFSDNALVTGEPYIRFYAGAPLLSPGGEALGTLCVIGREPRRLASEHGEALRVLSRQVAGQLELRRTVAALGSSEERFRLLANAISDALWDWDLGTDVIWWSEGFETLFGYKRAEIEPTSECWTTRLHPEDHDRVMREIDAFIATGKNPWNSEYRFRRKDGSYALVRDRANAIRNAQGRAIRLVGGMTDITDQKKLEAQYLRAQRMESIGTLAGGIAHDLNNVLAPIMMGLEMMKRDATPAHAKLLATIEASTRRGAELVRQVLTFARGMDGQRAALRLDPLLKELVKIAAETFPRTIAIERDIETGLWPIQGDPTQLHQVLLNLAVNARDAMPRGGTLTFGAANLVIDEQYVRTSAEASPGQHVLISVADTGVGIPPDILPRIFEPFFTTKPVGEGTGLGLSTVHAIVKSHGGFITVQTEPGKGTTFRIHLPADPALRSASEHPFVARIPRGNGELVLVVDDETAVRIVTQQTLEAFGYRVLTAADGAEAVALFASHRGEIDLVLTDMVMPVMDGATAIAAIRRIQPEVRIVAASGFNTLTNGNPAAIEGVNHLLSKPYNADTLLSQIRRVLDGT